MIGRKDVTAPNAATAETRSAEQPPATPAAPVSTHELLATVAEVSNDGFIDRPERDRVEQAGKNATSPAAQEYARHYAELVDLRFEWNTPHARGLIAKLVNKIWPPDPVMAVSAVGLAERVLDDLWEQHGKLGADHLAGLQQRFDAGELPLKEMIIELTALDGPNRAKALLALGGKVTSEPDVKLVLETVKRGPGFFYPDESRRDLALTLAKNPAVSNDTLASLFSGKGLLGDDVSPYEDGHRILAEAIRGLLAARPGPELATRLAGQLRRLVTASVSDPHRDLVPVAERLIAEGVRLPEVAKHYPATHQEPGLPADLMSIVIAFVAKAKGIEIDDAIEVMARTESFTQQAPLLYALRDSAASVEQVLTALEQAAHEDDRSWDNDISAPSWRSEQDYAQRNVEREYQVRGEILAGLWKRPGPLSKPQLLRLAEASMEVGGNLRSDAIERLIASRLFTRDELMPFVDRVRDTATAQRLTALIDAASTH